MPVPLGQVVAIVPAYNSADVIGATLAALAAEERIDRVLVVDDGSSDDTAARAAEADVEVVSHPANRGKGAALTTGVARCDGSADVVLFVDSDLGASAGATGDLLDHVGPSRLVVGIPTDAAGRGGFGLVRDLAARGIDAATGIEPRSPLSGQRALSLRLAEQLTMAPRFGVETAMTIDALRSGVDLVEIAIEVDHRHHGRSVAGFRHRAGQGADVVRALRPRLGLLGTVRVVLGVLWARARRVRS